MEKLKLNGDSAFAAIVAAKSTDAADGHEAQPTSSTQNHSSKQIDTEKVKPTTKLEEKPIESASIHIDEQNANGELDPSITAIDLSKLELIENGAEVWIKNVRNYQSVYVRAVANNDAYMTLITDVATAANTAAHLKSYPHPKEDIIRCFGIR